MSEDVTREVDQLLKDREKYESWLERLKSSKDATASQQAFDRVRQDYQQRLDEVVGKLRAHSDTIRAKLKEAERKVADVEKEREARSEKLEEARLRHAVGEYSDGGEWADLEGRLLTALRESEKELEAARTDITHLQDILESVQGAGAPPKPEAPPKAKPEPRAEAPSKAAPAPGANAPPVAPARPPQPPAEAKEAKPPPTPPPPARQKPAAPKAAEAPAEPELAEEGYLSLEELVLEDKSPEEAVIRPKGGQQAGVGEEGKAAEAAPEGEGGAVGDELAFLESLSLGGSEESESFSFLERHGSGTPQTIICPHCSAANDPAEWYCTECGEELPAE